MERRLDRIFSGQSAAGAQVVVDHIAGNAVDESGKVFRLTQLFMPEGEHDREHHFLREIARRLGVAGSCEDQDPDSIAEQADELLLRRRFSSADALSEAALLLGGEEPAGRSGCCSAVVQASTQVS